MRHKAPWVLVALVLMPAGVLMQGLVFADAGTETPEQTTQPSKVVDDQLVKKLLGGQSSARDTVEETLAHMEEAADRLTGELDPGEKTQAIQTEILKGLDQLIEEAAKSRSAPSRNRKVRRKADRPTDEQRRATGRKQSGASGVTPAPRGGGPADENKKGRQNEKMSKTDLARQWGFLPEPDRDEVIQGFDEEFLPKFREQINDYYRSLAEEAQKGGQGQP